MGNHKPASTGEVGEVVLLQFLTIWRTRGATPADCVRANLGARSRSSTVFGRTKLFASNSILQVLSSLTTQYRIYVCSTLCLHHSDAVLAALHIRSQRG